MFISCSTSSNLTVLNNSCNCRAIGVAAQGTIQLECEGFGKNFDDALSNARKNCLYQLLYMGVPNSNSIRPIVTNKSVDFDQEIMTLNILQYVKNSSEFINPLNTIKINKYIKTKNEFIVNLSQIREVLETNKIIKKLGEI